MRTVSRFRIDAQSIVPKDNTNLEDAALDLVATLLREERLLYPVDRPLVTVDLVRLGFEQLKTRSAEQAKPLGRLNAKVVMEAAIAALRSYSDRPQEAVNGDEAVEDLAKAVYDKALMEQLERQVRALREVIWILGDLPDEAEKELQNVRELIHDRDNGVYGLLFQEGLDFSIRMRHGELAALKPATERLVNVLAPRPASDLKQTIRQTTTVDRIVGRLRATFEAVELRTTWGSLAQTGLVHVFRSKLGLLAYLAIRSPQVYLVFLTVLLASLELVFKLGLAFDWTFRGLSLGSWIADFEARLATGAFGAYLVALFLRYGDVRNSLGSARRRGRAREAAYGAFIEWKTD